MAWNAVITEYWMDHWAHILFILLWCILSYRTWRTLTAIECTRDVMYIMNVQRVIICAPSGVDNHIFYSSLVYTNPTIFHLQSACIRAPTTSSIVAWSVRYNRIIIYSDNIHCLYTLSCVIREFTGILIRLDFLVKFKFNIQNRITQHLLQSVKR